MKGETAMSFNRATRGSVPMFIALAWVAFIPAQLLRAQAPVDAQTQIDQLRSELSELHAAFNSFKASSIKIEENLSQASVVILPVGSIVAYSGPIATLAAIPNWRLCNGDTVSSGDFPVLWERIKTTWGGTSKLAFKLPDLQGRFVRGVDGGRGRDPDAVANAREPNGNGERNTVGTTENDSTKLPNGGFSASGGSHSHDLNLQTNAVTVSAKKGWQKNIVANPWVATSPKKTITGGEHTHTISGGDPETRPKNAAVFWIIRVK